MDFKSICDDFDRLEENNNRKNTRRHFRGFDIPDYEENTVRKAERYEIFVELKLALACLTEKQRKVVVMHAVQQMTFREIGTRFCVNEKTIREHYYAGIKKLKKFFEKHPSKDVWRGYR